ncbi:ArnT family glycosyltransferase [Bacteroidota bacterium]
MRKNYVLIIILIIGIFFRFYNLGVPVLDVDEAEVYLASQSILDSGVPTGFYKIPFYENAYYYESNSTMYEFDSTNYYKSDLVLRKGWTTYYLTAFFSLFGKNEFLLRFPFVLISVFSMIFFFKFVKYLYNERTALISLFFYAVSPSLLMYERIVRYYSPMILFIILSLYFFVRAFKEKGKKNYLIGAVSLGLLFHTNILICLALCFVIGAYGLISKVKINKKLIHSAILFCIIVIPWILGTGFLWKLAYEPKGKPFTTGFIFERIVSGISAQGVLYTILFIAIITLIANLFLREKTSKTIFFWKNNNSNKLIILYLIFMIVIPFIIVPTTSFEDKLFVSLIPAFIILVAKFFDSIFDISENKNFRVSVIIIIILSVASFDNVFGHQPNESLSVKEIVQIERSSLLTDINYIIEKETNINPLILTTFNHFPLMFYTNYTSQIIWPIRKEFIDGYEDELVIVESGFIEGTCSFFYQYLNPAFRCADNKNYLDKIKTCQGFQVDETTTVYICNSDKENKVWNLGLFFSDFPENLPPDFIWDMVPFDISIDVKNYGDYNVDKLKVVFSGNLADKDFDKEKNEFIFNKAILSGLYESFDLGKLTFNHKLPIREKIINANIILCYPYSTTIKIYTCSDSLDICNYEVSGAPVQITNFSYDEEIEFKIVNIAEGNFGDFENCNSEDSSSVKIQSNFFECQEKSNIVLCEKKNVRRNSAYEININYDYQQEFKKAILLRSRERNQYDYENFQKE